MEHCHLSENYVWYDKIEFSFCVENYFVNNMGLFFKLCESQPLWMWWYTSHVVVNTVMEQHYHSLWVTFQFTLLCLFSTNSWGNYILTIFTIYWWNKCKKKKGRAVEWGYLYVGHYERPLSHSSHFLSFLFHTLLQKYCL